MSGKPKKDAPELLAAFEAALRATGNVTAAARSVGASKTVGLRLIAGHPEWRDLMASRGQLSRTHGMQRSREYASWAAMKNRCQSASSRDYPYYGARGVRVCAAWQSFAHFWADMGVRPRGKSLDRKDNDGHYSCGKCEECSAHGWPANCRWATAKEQASNRRNSRLYQFGGELLTMTELARRHGLKQSYVWDRVKSGATIGSALGLE